jgi:hypothetical protein
MWLVSSRSKFQLCRKESFMKMAGLLLSVGLAAPVLAADSPVANEPTVSERLTAARTAIQSKLSRAIAAYRTSNK